MDQQTDNEGSSSKEGGEMKIGQKVWVLCEVTEMNSESVKVNSGHGASFWVFAKQCKPVEPEAVGKVEHPEGSNAIFMMLGHDRNGTAGTAKLDGKFWFFESLDKQFLTWCKASELKFLNREFEAAVKQSLTVDAVNPSHYKQGPAETIDIIEAAIAKAPNNKAAGLHWQVLKYALRCWFKNGIEDLKKAKWYLDRLIREEEAK